MIPVQTAHLQVAAITHPGMRGKNNEDRFTVSAFKISEKDPTPTLLAIIADGVGGHRAGEVAADLAVTQISQVVATSDASQPLSILQVAFEQANQTINARSMADPALSGMGTTCVCAWVIDDRLFTASIGDSRIYLVRNGKASQLTIDHTSGPGSARFWYPDPRAGAQSSECSRDPTPSWFATACSSRFSLASEFGRD